MLGPALVDADQANAFVDLHHRHHDPDQGARFYVGAWDFERELLCGVAVVGRPRAPKIDQTAVVEVTRCATDGTRNACSFLYAASSDVARARGFRAIITYTLKTESGSSLAALGWWPEFVTPDDGATWQNRPGRKGGIRADLRWLKLLNDFRAPPVLAAEERQASLLLVAP